MKKLPNTLHGAEIVNNPLVSVVIPAFNAESYIMDSICSVFNQDYKNIEIIVVDDGSSDDTLALLSKLNGRISVLQQKNRGAAAARNQGIKVAKGEFIAFLDADDVWINNKISCQLRVLQETGCKMVYSKFAFGTKALMAFGKIRRLSLRNLQIQIVLLMDLLQIGFMPIYCWTVLYGLRLY